MNRERTTAEDGRSRAPDPTRAPGLGEVARDVMDHATIIVRDQVAIGRLEAQRYAARVRHDVAPRAVRVAIAGGLAAVAVGCGLVALFLGIARALDSVAWAFAIYCALFAAAALVAFAVLSPERRDEGDDLARRFPAARMRPTEPEHLLVAQRSTAEAHLEAVDEARREAAPRRP